MINPLSRLADAIYKKQPTPQPADASFNIKLLVIGGIVALIILPIAPLYYYWSSMADARSPEQAAAIARSTWFILAVGLVSFLVKFVPWAVKVIGQWRRRHD